MKEKIEVSISCLTYNHEKYVRDTLEGFVSQKTNFRYEVLVHDDASTDGTADIIREYANKYPEIIKPILQTENQYSKGVQINSVFQVPRIRGKYVAFCEGDDYWTDPLKLQKQFEFMEAHTEYTLCACSTVWLDMVTGESINKCQIENDRDISLEEIIMLKKGRLFQHAAVFMKAELYKELPKWFSSWKVGDYPLQIHAAMNGKIRMLADTMCVYRWRAPESWTSKMQNDTYKIKKFEEEIMGLESTNKETDFKYDYIIKKRVNLLKYRIAIIKHDIKGMRTGELREIYLNKNILHRLLDVLNCKYPNFYEGIRKLMGKNRF